MPLIPNPIASFRPARSLPAFLVTTALPAANANVTSAGIDLQTSNLDQMLGIVDIRLTVPATPNLASGQTLTLQLMDSADNVTFAAIASEPADVITGAGGIGGPATVLTHVANTALFLPRGAGLVRRYLALNVAASTTAGNNTAISSSIQLFY